MPTAWSLLRSSHPEPTLAVTVVAAGLALSIGRPVAGVLLVAVAVAAGQLSVGWLNDYLDAERDRTVGRGDKPVAAGAVSRRAVGVAALCAGVACVPLSLSNGLVPGVVHLLAVGSAYCYDIGLKSTPVSVVPYAVSFALLPAFVVLTGAGTPPWWLLCAGALLGSGAHFANALPDLADDAATGVRGLPHRLGRRAGHPVTAVLLLTAMALLVFAPPGPVGLAGPVLLVVAGVVLLYAAARRDRPRILFRAVMFTALLAVVLLITSSP